MVKSGFVWSKKNLREEKMLPILLLFGLVFGQCFSDDYPNSSLPEGFCARLWANGLSAPRAIWTADNGDILVLESGTSSITALWDSNNDGQSDRNERKVLGTYSGLNHALMVHGGFLYASSSSTLVRFPYSPSDRKLGPVQIVIQNIPSDGHRTRTPRIDEKGFLFLSLGTVFSLFLMNLSFFLFKKYSVF